MTSSQIPLSFPVSESYTSDDFIRADCNSEAFDWVQRWPDWPSPILVLYGPKGCGKTHLSNLWHHQSNNIVYDDAHKQFGSCEFEQELFHACNLAKENSTYLLVTIDKPIAQQSITLPDLSSRLAAAPQIAMHDPDDETLRYIMVKLLNDRQITVSPDVVQYILPRIERSFIAMQSLVKKLDDASLSEKRAITIPLVKSLIDA